MSYAASAWAEQQTAGSPQRKAVLMYLADKADDEWSCYPGQARIATVTELGERTVRRALADLETSGLIRREQRRRPDGYRTSDRYWLNPSPQQPATAAGEPPSSPANDAELTGQPGPTSPAATAGYPSGVTTSTTTSRETTSGPAAPPADGTLFEQPIIVDELCTELADAIAGYRDGTQGGRPTVTERWRRDMRLLLERGPVGTEAHPLRPANVRGCIAVVFGEMAEPEGSGTFCWAAQVQSPQALRRHWWKIRDAAKKRRDQLHRGGKMAALARQIERDTGETGPDLAEIMEASRNGTLHELYGEPRRALGAGA